MDEDHITLLQLGWEIGGFNYQMLCKACNIEKGRR